jgi:hypothetical protein
MLDNPSATVAQSAIAGLVDALAAKAATSSLAATATSTDAASLSGTLAAARIADGSLSTAKTTGLGAFATGTDAANLTGTLAAARIADGSLPAAKITGGVGTPWTYARCSADRTTTGQALADISDLSIALLANSVYEFEAILMVASSASTGNQYGVQFSAAGASVEAQISGTLAAATSRSDRIAALNTATPTYLTSGAAGGIRIQGVIVVGANAGNLTIRHLKVTSGTSTVRAQSFVKAFKLA